MKKKKTKKYIPPPTPEEFIAKHIGNMQHFIEQGGYPIIVNEAQEKSDLLELSWLYENEEGHVARFPGSSIQSHLLIAYWKYRCKEEQEEGNRLYRLIQDLARKA